MGLAGGVIGLAGCSPATLLNLTIPTAGYSIKTDVSYGNLNRQKLDIYIPNTQEKSTPVVVFYYGGSWDSGSKKDFKFVGQALAEKGFATVIADYRVYPEVKYPTFLEDSAAAFTWVQNNIEAYGLSPENIFLMGHSAGAYNAMMLAVKPNLANTQKTRGIISLAGPYDFLPFNTNRLEEIFSTVPAEETQPISYARAIMPTLLLWSDADKVVWSHNGVNMAAALKNAGTKVKTHVYKNLSHVDMVLALAYRFRGRGDILNRTAEFINQHKKRTP